MRALRKVLVVDDDPVIARSFDRVLSDKGYAVATASDGREALNKLGSDEYDVVFTDIKMPGMDGIEVAERVKSRRPWVPVVIITGYGTEANEARAEAAGVSDFLRKPLSPEVIEQSARKALSEAKAPAAPQPVAETAAPPAEAEAAVPAAAPRALQAPAKTNSPLKTLAMVIGAPVITLVFVIGFPFIGLAALAWMGVGELAKRTGAIGRFAKNVLLFFAAPFIGLAYVIAFPFIGLYLLISEAMKKGPEAE
jgi:CheY-like chemotaxis protein